jgi:hypothetical protein
VFHKPSREALATLVQQGTATLLTRQRLGCLDHGRVALEVVRRRNYVQGYELIGIADAMVADPQIGVLHDGMRLEIRPTRSEDRATLQLELKLTLTRLNSPVPSVRVPGRLPAESGFLLELPVFANERLETRAKVPADTTLCFGGLASSGGSDQLMIIFMREVGGGASSPAPVASKQEKG